MRRLALFLVLICIAFALIAGPVVERGADGMLRPWAVAKAAERLSAEVRLDRLELRWGHLELHGVEIARPGELRLRVPRITLDYTLSGLWRRRLEAVVIERPDLEWLGGGSRRGEPPAWPQRPPLAVAAWQVTDGRAQLTLGKKRLLLGAIAAEGSLGSRFRIVAGARLGGGAGVPLTVAGDGRWEGSPELTLTRLLWADRSLLQAPVTIAPGGGPLEATVSLERLDDDEAGRWLSILGHSPPWPQEIAWQVSSPRLTISLGADGLALHLEAAAGEVSRAGQRLAWEGLDVKLANAAGSWAIDGAVALPAQARLQLTANWTERPSGRWLLSVPAPAALCQAFGIALPAAAGELRDLSLAGELQAGAAGAADLSARLTARWREGFAVDGTMSGRWQQGLARLTIGRLALRERGRDLATAAGALAGQPAEQRWQGDWTLRVAEGLPLARALGATVPAALPDLQGLEMRGRLELAGNNLVLPVTDVSGRLAGAGLSARLAGQLAVHRQTAGWRCEIERLAVTAVEYASPDGLAGITNGALALAGNLDWQGALNFALRGEATAGEALFGSWYGDLAGLPLRLGAQGEWLPATGRVRLQSADLDLAGLLAAHLRGELARERLDIGGELTVPRLDGALQDRLRQLAAGMLAGSERLSLAGSLTADIAATWQQDGWTLQATVRPRNFDLGWGDSLRLTGLDGELPLLVQHGGPAVAGRAGLLTWQELQAGPLAAARGRARLAAAANRWQLADPLRLDAAGGWLELSGVALELTAAGPEMRTAVKAAGIDLGRLSRTVGGFELAGQLQAEFPEIRLTRETIAIGGEARLQVFSGEVHLRRLRLEQPFSRYPTYHADVDFTGINLRQLTGALAFGEINGVADGFVHDLRLFGAVPSAFDAVFATREEGTRNISVKALRNLNTLSQGGLSAALSQGIYRFIDFYRYRKIGIRCHLRNDVFHLEGTARPGTTTYLIDGGWLPPRLDVIASTPTISFREMVRRLKRIERTGD